MHYRLAAIDLDGTLMNSQNQVSERNAQALRRAIESGMVVAPATARPYQSARRIFDALQLEVPIIASGGASVRTAGGEVVREAALPGGVARELARTCRANGWSLTLATSEQMLIVAAQQPEWLGRAHRAATFVQDPADVPAEGVLSAIINGPPDAGTLLGLERWDGAVRTHRARTNDLATLTTITAAAADKGHGLRHLCEHLGVPLKLAVAFGDSEVDLPMFAVAGLAVAMGNASDEVQGQAHRLTASADDDGVAMVLELLSGGI